jgi:hypothetical protein
VIARNRAISRLRHANPAAGEELLENTAVLPISLESEISQQQLLGRVKSALLAIAFLLVGGGIALELLPKLLSSFVINITMPNVGWFGVYAVAIAFDVIAATLAFFVLKRMKVPVKQTSAATMGQPAAAPAHGD